MTAGHDPELHLAERELRVRRRDRDVAAGDEPAAAAERMPLHARDDRRRAAVDRVEHRAQPQRVGDVLLVRQLDRRAHPLDVGAGRERRAVAREHDRARIADVGERLGQLGDQRGVERVAPLRPRHRDPQHGAVALDPQRARDHRTGRAPRSCRGASATAIIVRPSGPATACRVVSGSNAEGHRRADRHFLAVDSIERPPPLITMFTSSWPDAASLCSRPSAFARQLEPVDAERLDAELAAQRTDHRRRAPRLDLCDVDHGVAHGSDLTPGSCATCGRCRRSSRGSAR